MNRRYALLPAMLPVMLAAQPNPQQSMVDPNGINLTVHSVVSPGSSQQPTGGANQTWDLSTTVLLNVGTLDFVPAAGTPYASSYPSANWAWVTTITGLGPDHMYITINSDGIELVADDVPGNPNIYTDTKKLISFPMTYGQTILDPYVDMDGAANVAWTYAGYGTTIMPFGSFPNTMLLTSNEGDAVIWNTAPLHPLAIDDGTDVLFFGPANVGVDEAAGPMAIKAFPNPCTEVLNVDLPGDAGWRITDLQGRQVLAGRSRSAAQQALPVASLAPGAYVLLVDEAGATRGQRFVKD
ncbi:MAG: T9SS type A sorting domain-containing protein [Flavobacteriales bacterium]|nr:T9SS type A sorting domain-containing protein [Flavobacteriales bacterium]